MTNNNTNFISTEVDLDRDVPGESYYDSLMTTGFDVDVDENGPFITSSVDPICHYSGLPSVASYKTESDEIDYDGDWVSECCGAELIVHDQLCGDCKEHTTAIPEDDEVWMEKYLDANPDFNAALNGHADFIF